MENIIWVALLCAVLALLFAAWKTSAVSKADAGTERMKEIAGNISDGARAFLFAEYKILVIFVAVLFVLIGLFISWLTAVCFLVGAVFSVGAGYVGMNVATKANVRTAAAAKSSGMNKALGIAFSGGSVMGMCVVGLGLLGCAAIAIGVFLSSLTENQIIAAVAGVAALLLAYMMPSLRSMFTAGSAVALALFTAIAAVLSVVAGLRTRSFTLGCLTFAGCCVVLTALFLLQSSWLTEAFSAVLSGLCLFTPFEEFVNNSFSIPTLVYYLTVTMLFLFFTAQGLEKRRWN